jgi:hypothetical protein
VGLELSGTRLKKSIYAAASVFAGSVQIWKRSTVEGQLFFDGATVSGDLRCDESTLTYKKHPEDIELNEPSDEAVRGAGLEIKGSVCRCNVLRFVGQTRGREVRPARGLRHALSH